MRVKFISITPEFTPDQENRKSFKAALTTIGVDMSTKGGVEL